MKYLNKVKRSLYWYRLIKDADNMILYYPKLKAQENRVNVHIHDVKLTGWKYYDNGSYPYNLGDYLAVPICDFMLKKKGIDIDKPISCKKHLFTVGSAGLRSFQNATMWGTGIMYDGLRGAWWEKYWDASHRQLDIRAVRGPLTREVFLRLGHKCPEIYGDPGILMPLIYKPTIPKFKKEFAIIPQYTREIELRSYYPDDNLISMCTNDYKAVIDKIVSCKIVYSSSLHGIILAESYGVPAIFFRQVSSKIDFKYKDYYASTGRFDVPMANNLAEAFSFEAPAIPDLKILQDNIMNAFPYDLWEI